ncbi:MAG: NifB/NifX family molybdenum-iron cluster-binding protein [Fusobacteriota bacterium]
MKLKVACATDNGKELKKDHFGDAKYYHIYEVDKGKFCKILEIKNPKYDHEHDDEDVTGDPQKAMGIAKILKKNGVQVMLAYQIGPNIVRMKKNFVPVVSRSLNIKESLRELENRMDLVKKEYKAGEDRNHIILNIN